MVGTICGRKKFHLYPSKPTCQILYIDVWHQRAYARSNVYLYMICTRSFFFIVKSAQGLAVRRKKLCYCSVSGSQKTSDPTDGRVIVQASCRIFMIKLDETTMLMFARPASS